MILVVGAIGFVGRAGLQSLGGERESSKRTRKICRGLGQDAESEESGSAIGPG